MTESLLPLNRSLLRRSITFAGSLIKRGNKTPASRLLLVAFLLQCCSNAAQAQDDDVLAAAPFPKAYIDAFESLLDEKYPNPSGAREILCRKFPTEVSARPPEFKSAFIKSSVDLSTSIVFSSKKTPSDSFTFDVQFMRTGLVVKHSRVARAADYDGLHIPPPRDWFRYVLYRGKGGTDLVLIVPALEDCSSRALMICPRALSMGGVTKPTDFAPSVVTVSGHAEAEGIFAVDSGEQATTVVEVKATEGIPLPIQRKHSTTATSAISTLKFDFPAGAELPTELPLSKLPSVSALETLVRFVKPTKEAFQYSSRSELIVAPYELKTARKITLSEGILHLSAGGCFTLMKRLETKGETLISEESKIAPTPTIKVEPTPDHKLIEEPVIDPY